MRVRLAGLGILAAVILGGGLYLFLQVTSGPSPAAVAANDDRPRVHDTRTAVEPGPGSGARFSPTPIRTGSGKVEPPPHDTTATGTGTGSKPTGTGPVIDPDTGDEAPSPDVDLDAAMDEANKYYDDNDYDAAMKQAIRVLGKEPENIRMLRIVVSSGCMMGDADTATKYYDQLPARDQSDMQRRCERYDIHFKAQPQKSRDPAGTGPSPGIRKPE